VREWAVMTVAELIELLKTAPQEEKVILAGCDCENECIGLLVDHRFHDGVLLTNKLYPEYVADEDDE